MERWRETPRACIKAFTMLMPKLTIWVFKASDLTTRCPVLGPPRAGPSLGFPRLAATVGRNWSYPEVVLSSQASHASIASLSWAGAIYYFIYF